MPGLFRRIGPGIITGASDDDPSGIGTYAQAGARLGYAPLWTLLFTIPLMSAIQSVCARIGRATGAGIAANLRERYSAWILWPAVGALVIANTINLGADIVAMGAATELVVGGPVWAWALGFAVLTLTLQLALSYKRYLKVLKWLTLSLAAYVIVAFLVRPPWGEVARATLVPSFSLDRDFLLVLVALLGTTISPYLFFWQASQEVEEIDAHPRREPLNEAPEQAARAKRRIGIDTIVGMVASNLVSFFIILAAAATLHASGQRDINGAAEAAEALRPLAGPAAATIFALGLVATGLLAVPVLSGSAAYGLAETFGWKASLDEKPWRAKRFYTAIAATTLGSLLILALRIDPMQALVWSAVVNGIAAVPLMFLVMRLGSDARTMGENTTPPLTRALGWIATLVMAAAAIVLVGSFFL